jgi:hypothetical protein
MLTRLNVIVIENFESSVFLCLLQWNLLLIMKELADVTLLPFYCQNYSCIAIDKLLIGMELYLNRVFGVRVCV